MAETSHIEWCDSTFNGWLGCMKVGPGCDFCYAETLMDTRHKRVKWGKPGSGVGTRVLTSDANWKKPLKWDREAAAEQAAWDAMPRHQRRGARPTRFVFCSSLADVFDNQVPVEWRRRLFDLIRATPNLTWLLLTKRPQNIVTLFVEQMTGTFGAREDQIDPETIRNAWPANAAIGCTVVNQAEADRDVFTLLLAAQRLNPAFTFLSIEPMLGPINLRRLDIGTPKGFMDDLWGLDALTGRVAPQILVGPPEGWVLDGGGQRLPKVDWVICGGESGPKARPMHLEWARSLRDQCAAVGTPFLWKQWGEWGPIEALEPLPKHGRVIWLGNDGVVHEPPRPDTKPIRMVRAGKKWAGRLLDGHEHNDRPTPRAWREAA